MGKPGSGPTIADVAAATRNLRGRLENAPDVRQRMKLCREAVGLGKAALKSTENLGDGAVDDLVALLRVAHTASRGFENPSAVISKLSRIRLERRGITELPLISTTRSRVVGTDAACFALADRPLPGGWPDTSAALTAMNAGRYALAELGADGGYSACLRLVDAPEPFLDLSEYAKILDVTSPFAIHVETGTLMFGAAENLAAGVALALENGRYIGSVTALRSGRGTKLVATVVRSEAEVEPFHTLPDLSLN
jgi:hypothetical protein